MTTIARPPKTTITTNLTTLKTSPGQSPSPTSATAPLTNLTTRPRSCYLCDEQNPGDFSPTVTRLSTCLLCNRDFCPIHRNVTYDTICNLNHSKHYHERLEDARKEVARRRQASGVPGDKEFDEAEAEEILVRAGIYPSLGEREKMVWSSTPVSGVKMREIEAFRNRSAEHGGTKGRTPSSLIETKEFIGADVAV